MTATATAAPVTDEESGLEVRFNLHPRKKNNLRVAAMYGAYSGGMSLEEVARLYRVSRQAVYDVFRTRGYPLRSKESAGRYHTTCHGTRWYKTKGGYLRGTVGGVRKLLHQHVWELSNGPIPPGHVLHFKDGNPARCALSNLELVPKGQMSARFNPERRTNPAKSWETRRARKAAKKSSWEK